MRITGGKFGGRKILTGKGDTRPAMGKTREALFSMLGARGIGYENLRVLDIFAGTGSLGFEAISRGASHADFVERSGEMCKLLRSNAESLGISGRCDIYCEDAGKFLARPPSAPYGLIFIDPPYRQNLTGSALSRILSSNHAVAGSFVCAEVEKDAEFTTPEALSLLAARNFGQTVLHIWLME